jgi:hypothetical protein
MRILLGLALVTSLATVTTACGVEPDDEYGDGGGDGKADGTSGFTWSSKIPNIVPKNVHNYLQKYQWGEYHIDFHMTRRWYILGESGRTWLKHVGEGPADVMEGDPGNGLEFLTMHRAMIEHLTMRWGKEPVTNNEDGRKTFAAVLKGWSTDADVIAHLTKVHGDVATFKAALTKVNDFKSFKSEDEFGLFLETTLRLTGEVDPNDSAKRFYGKDMTTGAGIHNWLHGQFADATSPCDVGNPETNLSNQRFWAIHGWIEAKWEAFEKVHVRTTLEQAQYEEELERFRLHMQLHSDYSTQHHPHNVPPKTLVKSLTKTIFLNGAPCANVSADAVLHGCTPKAP